MTAELISSSSSPHTISSSDFKVKLRRDMQGVALSHDDVDNNFETLRRTLNDLIEDVDAITAGTLANITPANLKVDNILDGAVDTAQIADDAVTVDKMAPNSVGAEQIIDGSLSLSDLAGGGALNATTSADGLMSSSDKTKLDGVSAGANLYVHPTYNGDDFNQDTGALSGLTVVSDIDINLTTDTTGHVTDANCSIATRTLGFSGDVAIASDGTTTIQPDAVTGSMIADDAITASHIEAGAITETELDLTSITLGGEAAGVLRGVGHSAGDPGTNQNLGGPGLYTADIVWDKQVGGVNGIPINVKEVCFHAQLGESQLWFWNYLTHSWTHVSQGLDNNETHTNFIMPIGVFPTFGDAKNAWMYTSPGYGTGIRVGGGTPTNTRNYGGNWNGSQVGPFSPQGGARFKAAGAPNDQTQHAVWTLVVLGWRT
tara:strand:- start:469 stop:1758 length:1290 start_codon:yes stop_codon:yes gene_type:complete